MVVESITVMAAWVVKVVDSTIMETIMVVAVVTTTITIHSIDLISKITQKARSIIRSLHHLKGGFRNKLLISKHNINNQIRITKG